MNAKSSDTETATIDPRKTVVPNVVGLSADEAERILHERNLGYKYDSEYVYSEQYPADYVVDQSEKAGDVIEKNKTVILTISKGAEKIEVPAHIKGLKVEDAQKALEKAGLRWEVTYDYSSSTIDTVISCYPLEKSISFPNFFSKRSILDWNHSAV